MARRASIVGNLAYVTAYSEDSLTILNITDPYNMNIACRGLRVRCHDEDGFAAIHIADPSNLTIVGFVEDSTLLEESWAVAVNGNYAFVHQRTITP